MTELVFLFDTSSTPSDPPESVFPKEQANLAEQSEHQPEQQREQQPERAEFERFADLGRPDEFECAGERQLNFSNELIERESADLGNGHHPTDTGPAHATMDQQHQQPPERRPAEQRLQ